MLSDWTDSARHPDTHRSGLAWPQTAQTRGPGAVKGFASHLVITQREIMQGLHSDGVVWHGHDVMTGLGEPLNDLSRLVAVAPNWSVFAEPLCGVDGGLGQHSDGDL